MRGVDVREHILGLTPPEVRARNDPQRTVLGREIVEHPNTVADRISFLVRQQTHVDVERLEARGIGIRRPYIQAAEFELRSQHGLNQLQDFWPPYGLAEHFALIYKVRQTASIFLAPELAAGGLPLFGEQLVHAGPNPVEHRLTHVVFEYGVAGIGKLATLRIGDHHS